MSVALVFIRAVSDIALPESMGLEIITVVATRSPISKHLFQT